LEYKINTSIPINFEMIEEIPDSRFLKVKIWLCHTGENLNGSYFSKELLETMKNESLSNIPILGYISIDNLNESDFLGHEERIIIQNGEIKIEYVGKIYGLIPETNNAQFEFKLCDDGIEREFLTCEGLLYTRFPECIDIFNRDESKSQSMELEPDSISGKFEIDNLFHFETAKFEGACILGDTLTPAMVNSTIEKFSIKNIKIQLQEMIVELNNTVFNKNNQEGGTEILDAKFELIKNYDNLTEEDVLDLKTNHEQYSLEEFEAKLKELSEAKNIPPTDFALTAEQLNDEVRKVLRNRRVISEDWWGDEYSENEFYYRDIKDNLVIVIDNSWENYYGIPYMVDGDTVTIDFENKIAYMYDWRPRVDGEVVDNFAKQEFEEKLKAFTDKATEKVKSEVIAEYEVKITEFNSKIEELSSNSQDTILVEFENLKSKVTEYENNISTLTEQFNSLKTENETLISSNEILTQTNTSLQEFRTNIEQQQQEAFEAQQLQLKAELIENFSKVLTMEEIKSIEEKNLSIEDMDKEFKIMYASKELSAKFAKKTKKTDTEIPIFNFSLKKKEDWTSLIPKK